MPVTNERAGVPLSSAITVPGSVTEYVTPGVEFDRSVDIADDWLTFRPGPRTLTAGGNPAETVGVAPLAPRRSEWDVSGLDDANVAGETPVQISVAARTRDTGEDAAVTDLEFSTDDGVTWQRLPLSGSGAELQVPASAAFISLRATATNQDGGSLRRTIIRAFAGPAR